MKLLLTRGWDGNQELISEKPNKTSIEQLVHSLNWLEFNSITLKQDENNWMDVSGNLNEDGLAIIVEENGTSHISENPPQTTNEIISALQLYLKGEFTFCEFLSGKAELYHKKSAEYDLWKIQYDEKRRIERRNRKIAIAATLLIISLISFLVYLFYTDELKFIGHKTEYYIATVIHTKWNSARGGGLVQNVTYQFQYQGKNYQGFFIGNKFTGKHQVNDRIKIKFSVEDPAISKRIATLKKK